MDMLAKERATFVKYGKLTYLGKYAPLAGHLGLEGKSDASKIADISGIVLMLRHERLEHTNKEEWKRVFRKRSAEDILKSGVSYGCTDDAVVFVALARSCGIPAKYVTGKRVCRQGGHNWAEVWMDGRWTDVEPQYGKPDYDYVNDRSGPYCVLSRSLDPADSVMTSYEDWLEIEKHYAVLARV